MTFTECCHRMLHDGDKTKAHRVAARMGRSYSTVMKWGLDCNGEKKPVRLIGEDVVPFTLSAEDFLLLDWMEAAVGRVAIALPSGSAGTRELAANVCKLVAEFGELAKAAGDGISDGTLTRKEADVIDREALDVQRAIAGLVAACRAAVKA